MARGPKPDYAADKKVLKMREKRRLSFGEISTLTGEDKKQVYIRYRRAGGKLVGRLS
jgi:hypothetical protein